MPKQHGIAVRSGRGPVGWPADAYAARLCAAAQLAQPLAVIVTAICARQMFTL